MVRRMPSTVQCSVTLTETAPFRRLVTFVEQADALADRTGNRELAGLVGELFFDLADMRRRLDDEYGID
jgi:hypothetical protein